MTPSPTEEVLGYFWAGGLRHGFMIYVTTDRIIVNVGKGQFDWRVHVTLTVLIALGPLLPSTVGLALLFGVLIIVSIVFMRNRGRPKGWPQIDELEKRRIQFQVRKGRVIQIELKKPSRLRGGHFFAMSLYGESFRAGIRSYRTFKFAKSLLFRFEPDRSKISE